MSKAGESEDAVLEALDGAGGDAGFAEVGEGLGEEFVLGDDGGAGLGEGLDEGGEVLRGDEVGVGAAETEMGLEEFDFAEGVHFAGAGGLVEEVGEVEEVEEAGEGAFGPGGALGHEGEASGLLREAAEDEAGVAEGHAADDEAADGLRLAHEGSLDRRNMKDRRAGGGSLTELLRRAVEELTEWGRFSHKRAQRTQKEKAGGVSRGGL